MLLDGRRPDDIARAADLLVRGELVAFPTETVYGLGANAADDAAVARIFAAKGRPADHPLIVHVAPGAAADAAVAVFADHVPDAAHRLMQAFWPGPLTLILPRRAGVGTASAGGQDSIGLRCPSHPVAQALLAECARLGVHGLSGPSANRFGRVSPTTAAHVQAEFGESVAVLDGGPCDVGIESAIVDCTRAAPVLLRPGVLTRARIEAALGHPLVDDESAGGEAPRASGTLESHYAPSARVRLMDARSLQAALDVLGEDAAHIAVWSRALLRSRSGKIIRRRMPDDAQAVAQQLFAVLREFDDQSVKLIWIETLPDMPEWEGVADRLRRAAA
ncbi:MAG: threonylcarbamoyl-AMP synthase [Burkholderiaceae bacterium]|nr:threonylcarbamoyl-AMP synthase [Burkholderiaceae bacterium]